MKRLHPFVIVLAVASVAAAQGEETSLRIFDVRQLLEPAPDRPGPERGPSADEAFQEEMGPLFDLEEPGEGAAFTEEELLQTIHDLDDDLSWELAGSTLKIIRGRLYARHTTRHLDALAALLTSLEKSLGDPVALRGVFFKDDPTADMAAKAILTDVDARALLGRVLASGNWAEPFSITGTTGQQFHAMKGTQFLYLSEYDVEVAQEALIHDPVPAASEHGILVDAKVFANPTKRGWTLVLRASCTRGDKADQPRTVTSPGGIMELPSGDSWFLQTVIQVPKNGWVLMGSTDRRGDDGGMRLLVKVSGLVSPDERKGKGTGADREE